MPETAAEESKTSTRSRFVHPRRCAAVAGSNNRCRSAGRKARAFCVARMRHTYEEKQSSSSLAKCACGWAFCAQRCKSTCTLVPGKEGSVLCTIQKVGDTTATRKRDRWLPYAFQRFKLDSLLMFSPAFAFLRCESVILPNFPSEIAQRMQKKKKKHRTRRESLERSSKLACLLCY